MGDIKVVGPMRTLTLVLKVKDAKAAKAIWDAHSNLSLINGCLVTTIAEGDAVEELETLKGKVDEFRDALGERVDTGDLNDYEAEGF